MQMAPARMMSSEQTVARIGRRMKTSESKRYRASPPGAAGEAGALGAATCTGTPSAIFCTPDVISFSPARRPDFTT